MYLSSVNSFGYKMHLRLKDFYMKDKFVYFFYTKILIFFCGIILGTLPTLYEKDVVFTIDSLSILFSLGYLFPSDPLRTSLRVRLPTLIFT